MAKINRPVAIGQELIERQICIVRGQRVMLDGDLAKLYGVRTRELIKQSGGISRDFRVILPISFPHRSLQT